MSQQLPSSVGSTTSSAAPWRVSHPLSTPPLETNGDLGSDDGWCCTMGSQSDRSTPTSPDDPFNTPISLPHSLPDQNHLFDIDAHLENEENQQVDYDHLAHPSFIPGYRGVNTRSALVPESRTIHDHGSDSLIDIPTSNGSIEPSSLGALRFDQDSVSHQPIPNDPRSLSSNWADRPRQAHRLFDPNTPQKTSSTPPLTPLHDPDLLLTPGATFSTNDFTIHSSPRISSDISPGDTPTKSPSTIRSSHRAPVSFGFSSRTENERSGALNLREVQSARTSGSLRQSERKISGLRSAFRENPIRLAATRLAGNRHQNKRSMGRMPSGSPQGNGANQGRGFRGLSTARRHKTDPLDGDRRSRRPLSTKSESMAYSRHSSGVAQQSGSSSGADQPMSLPSHIGTGRGPRRAPREPLPDIFFETGIPLSIPEAPENGTGHQASSTLIRRDMSYLECVVDILKGSQVVKRKGFMNAVDGWIWLTPDMKKIMYKTSKKGAAPVVQWISLSAVERLKGTDRDLTFTVANEKRPFDFVFPSRDRAEVWLSGLSCLIPLHAKVKSRNRKSLQTDRIQYDPHLDVWNEKPVASKKRLKDLILLGTIGRGSFGKVKLAMSSKNRQFFAVKVLSKSMLRKKYRTLPFENRGQKPDMSAKISADDINEIKIMRYLDHTNVMRMKGVFDWSDEDHLFIVVEYLSRGPIMDSSQLRNARPLREDIARSAFIDVLSGLDYLHSMNIAHRDIKPDNLLQAGDGTVKISDLGAAIQYADDFPEAEQSSMMTTSTVGTPAFTAPELCLSDFNPDTPAKVFAADIWSLGASLYYMIFGRAPFLAASVFEMYDTICRAPLEWPSEKELRDLGSKSCRQLIEKMLVKDPNRRITIAEIVKCQWLNQSADVSERVQVLRGIIAERMEAERF